MESLGIIGIGIVALLSYISFKYMENGMVVAILFVIVGAVSIILGLESPDIVTGSQVAGQTMGLMLIVYSFFCFGLSFRLLFWREQR